MRNHDSRGRRSGDRPRWRDRRQPRVDLLYGLAPTDAMAMAGAMTVMVLVSALAGYLPARHASRIDPLVALHYE